MKQLDELNKIKKIDRQGMLETEENFYHQLVEAKKIADSADLSKIAGKNYTGIAFLGMGGSGFVGDLIKSLIMDDSDIPIETVKGYSLPGYIDKDWLVVPVSYSGNTEETISCLKQAKERGATLLFVASGGLLEEMAEEYEACMVKVPAGHQPRGAIGFLFLPTLLALRDTGLAKVNSSDIDSALGQIKELSEKFNRGVETDKNFAKQIAMAIGNSLPVVYGSGGYLSAIAYRWKCEINENGKTPCFWAEFPELNHNETVGWERLAETTRKLTLLILRDEDENIRMKTRIDTTVGLVKTNFSKVIEIPVKGKSKLAKALSAMYTGDIASVYLALLHGVDPTPVEKIEKLKAELAKLD